MSMTDLEWALANTATDLERARTIVSDFCGYVAGGRWQPMIDDIGAALAAARREGEVRMRDECLIAIAEQRCERGTPWDLALQAALAAVRALPLP